MPMLVSPRTGQTLREAPQVMPTASGLTPDEIKRRRQMAQAMTTEGSSYAPVQHWTQGAARLANALAGNWEESRLDEQEGAARTGAQEKLTRAMDPKAGIVEQLAYANDPFANQGVAGAMMTRALPQQTDDMREYDWAVKNGFKGSPMDYMQALKTPVFQAPPGYSVAPGSTPGAPKVVRAEGLPADPAAAPKPSVQNAEDEDIGAVQTGKSIEAQLSAVADQIKGGELELGPWTNLGSQARNWAGVSSPNSINFATFKATLEKLRLDTLSLQKGVQTESDAKRAWDTLIANVNDPAVVQAQIKRIIELNQMGSTQRLQKINIRRQRNNMQPFDPGEIASPGLGGAAPPAPEQFAPPNAAPDGMTPAPAVAPAAPRPAPAAARTPPPKAIEELKADPSAAAEFDEEFGPGAAEAILGGQGGPMMAAPPARDPYGLQDLTQRREKLNARTRMLTRP